MTAPAQQRARRLQALTLVVTIGLAVALGAILWLSVSSLPYLATSPTTDPAFGSLNACLLGAVPERVGFAVGRDAQRVAAWSASQLVECAGAPLVPTTFSVAGVTLGAYDGTGALWVATGSGEDGGTRRLLRVQGRELVPRGDLRASALTGTATGVVVFDPSGQLVSLTGDGAVTATRALSLERNVQLISNDDGTLVALFGGGRFAVVNATTLESTPAEAPCPVQHAWWRAQSPLLLVECVEFTLEINALDAQSALASPRQRVRSVLSGPGGVYVQACDQLPCSAPAPR